MVITGGAQDDQLHAAFVFFNLRTQVPLLASSTASSMQTERIPDLVELLAAGLERAGQTNPP